MRTALIGLANVGPVERWDQTEPGVLWLPSGRRVRGRGLRRPAPGGARPEFGLYLGQAAPADGLAVAVGAVAGLAAAGRS